MNTETYFRTPSRWFALALVLVGTSAWAVSPTAPVKADTALEGIPPYGAVHDATTTASEAILPYGAMNGPARATSESILPYGAMSHDVTVASASILPYGALGHVAP